MAQLSAKKIAKMTSRQKAKRLFADILKSNDLKEISALREEMDYYLDLIEQSKVRKVLNKHYAANAATAPTASTW